MKKKILLSIILMLGLLLVVRECESTDTNEEFFGFRLGMSEKELKAMVNSSMLYYDPLSSWHEEGISHRNKIFELKTYAVSDDLILKDMLFIFFEDQLYWISVTNYDSKVEELLTQKYGKPEATIDERTEGENTKDLLIVNSWKTNDRKVKCMSFSKPNNSNYYHLSFINTKIQGKATM